MYKIRWEINSKLSLDVKWLPTPSMDGFLEHLGSDLGANILAHFPKLGILNSFKFACIAKVAFDAAAGSFWAAICVNLALQLWCNSYFGATNFMIILFSESRSPLRL